MILVLQNCLIGSVGKIGGQNIHRYLPDAHYWPERSFKETKDIHEKPIIDWKLEKPRPLQLLKIPTAH